MDFDPQVISYGKLLRLVWAGHDPKTLDASKQYRAAIFYHDEMQQQEAEASARAQAKKLGVARSAVRTPIQRAGTFTLAEDYHQKYRLQTEPVLARDFKRYYPTAKELIGSTAAARVNGYISGYGSKQQFARELGQLGLSAQGRSKLTAGRS